MSKQEEIREEIRAYLAEAMDGIEFSEEDEKGLDVITKNLLEFLHSQGCVLKVDGELPGPLGGIMYHNGNKAYHQAEQDMLKAGYVAVESLIEGSK